MSFAMLKMQPRSRYLPSSPWCGKKRDLAEKELVKDAHNTQKRRFFYDKSQVARVGKRSKEILKYVFSGMCTPRKVSRGNLRLNDLKSMTINQRPLAHNLPSLIARKCFMFI